MKNKLILILSLILSNISLAQVDSVASGSVEIFVIDSYITPETPHKFVLSFFTSDSTTSDLLIIGAGKFAVSKKIDENHKVEIDLSQFKISENKINYKIYVKDIYSDESESQIYSVIVPQNIIVDSDRNLGMLQVCCFGGIIFGLPSPSIVFKQSNKYYSLSKEIPIFSFYSHGYNYPAGYIGIEYSYIFDSDKKNFVRVGYKQIIQVPGIKYIAPGLNYFSDFKGYNGISSEISIGFFQIQNVFTLYSRYRYNFQPDRGNTNFHEISIGLYSNFFSLNIL